jgi:hypothetical protein
MVTLPLPAMLICLLTAVELAELLVLRAMMTASLRYLQTHALVAEMLPDDLVEASVVSPTTETISHLAS